MKSKGLMEIGETVMVYDRYRLASPAKAVIEKFSSHNDGVQLKLLPSKEGGHRFCIEKWPEFWVHHRQIEVIDEGK